MKEVGIAEAASLMKVSVDTVRRRIRTGKMPGRIDEKGRLLVKLEGFESQVTAADSESAAEMANLKAELARSKALLAEAIASRDNLKAQVKEDAILLNSMRLASQQDEAARQELSRLIVIAQAQMRKLLEQKE